MEYARTLEVAPGPAVDESPLARARIHRQLTVEEAARRSDLAPDEVQWLEEGRLYRFPTPDRALLATVLYATALGIEHREALELAGLPVPPLQFVANPWRRLGALAAIGIAVLAGVLAVVLNGSGDIVYTRSVASRVQALSYRVTHVGRASSFNYPQTQVYYPPGAEAIGTRLAKQLGVPVQPLPGGLDPRRLVLIVGPQRGPGS